MSPVLHPKSRKRLVIAAGIVLAFLVAVPFLVPLGFLIPRIEQAASQQLGDPVKIASLRVFVLPYPHLTLGGIQVGAKPHLQVSKLAVAPRLLSLLGSHKVIREVSLRGVVIHQPFLGKAAALGSRPASKGESAVRVERIEIRDADINLEDFRLRQIDLDVSLNADGSLALAQLRAEGGALQADLLPKGRDYSLALQARNWKLPAGAPLMISSLDARGTIGGQGLSLPQITGRFYDGKLAGRLAIGWKDGFSIAGKLDLKDADVKPLVAVFSHETTLSGRLSASPVIDTRAESASQLGQALHIESPFRVDNGVIHDFDLAAAPKALIDKDALKGGQTKFDQFSGYLIVDPAGYHLVDIRIASGVLKAEGEVSISPELKLDGLIDASVKGASALVSTPLAVAGTVQDPFIYPSKAAIAGAAAGTALLGPGLGTTAGMKVMRFTGKLFGKKKRAPRPQSELAARPDTALPPANEASAKRTEPSRSGAELQGTSSKPPATRAAPSVETSGRR